MFHPNTKYVLWPRIARKSRFKLIVTAGGAYNDGRMDLAALRTKIAEPGADNICSVMTTTCCFAPQVPDR